MGRRQFGAIRKLPSGRYQARLPDGATAPITFPTKAAGRWLAIAEADLVRGVIDDRPPPTDVTVGEWLDEWQRDKLGGA